MKHFTHLFVQLFGGLETNIQVRTNKSSEIKKNMPDSFFFLVSLFIQLFLTSSFVRYFSLQVFNSLKHTTKSPYTHTHF